MRRAAAFFLTCVMAAGVGAAAFAAEPEKPKVVATRITGEVSAASSSGIAVQYGNGKDGAAQEIYLPLDKKTKFQRFTAPSQLKPGDTVEVAYEQKYQEPEKGKKVYLGAVATEVVLLQQAPAQGALISKDEAAR